MLSKGKQITLGIFTVIGISVLATLALGENVFIDTIVFAEEKPILLCVIFVLYFAVFVIYAALAKRKKLEIMAKTTTILGAVLPACYFILMLGYEFIDGDGILASIVYVFMVFFSVVSYPFTVLAYPFMESNGQITKIFGMVVLVAAPIVAGIIYLFTKRLNKTEKTEIQVPAKKE